MNFHEFPEQCTSRNEHQWTTQMPWAPLHKFDTLSTGENYWKRLETVEHSTGYHWTTWCSLPHILSRHLVLQRHPLAGHVIPSLAATLEDRIFIGFVSGNIFRKQYLFPSPFSMNCTGSCKNVAYLCIFIMHCLLWQIFMTTYNDAQNEICSWLMTSHDCSWFFQCRTQTTGRGKLRMGMMGWGCLDSTSTYRTISHLSPPGPLAWRAACLQEDLQIWPLASHDRVCTSVGPKDPKLFIWERNWMKLTGFLMPGRLLGRIRVQNVHCVQGVQGARAQIRQQLPAQSVCPTQPAPPRVPAPKWAETRGTFTKQWRIIGTQATIYCTWNQKRKPWSIKQHLKCWGQHLKNPLSDYRHQQQIHCWIEREQFDLPSKVR